MTVQRLRFGCFTGTDFIFSSTLITHMHELEWSLLTLKMFITPAN